MTTLTILWLQAGKVYMPEGAVLLFYPKTKSAKSQAANE
jgi:hypothetical protein